MLKPESLGIFQPGTTWRQVGKSLLALPSLIAVTLTPGLPNSHPTHTQNPVLDHPTRIERLAEGSVLVSDLDGIRHVEVYVPCSASDAALLRQYTEKDNPQQGVAFYFATPIPTDYVLRIDVEDSNGNRSRRFL